MSTLGWIVTGSLLMSAIALTGSITLVLGEQTLKKILLPLVAFAAGTLIGSAFLHMIPAGIASFGNTDKVCLWVLAGFLLFFALEQLLQWQHCQHETSDSRQPLTYLILIGDGLHNFIGGLAIAGTFLVDVRLGIMAWLAAAAHEVPQEIGDFGVLVHGGWAKASALLFNMLSALTFLVGALTAYLVSFTISVDFLIPLAAGNFIYIAASDLVPEVNKHASTKNNIVHFAAFSAGILLMWLIKAALG